MRYGIDFEKWELCHGDIFALSWKKCKLLLVLIQNVIWDYDHDFKKKLRKI